MLPGQLPTAGRIVSAQRKDCRADADQLRFPAGRSYEANDLCCRSASICSRLRPLVSVTRDWTKRKASTPMTAYPRNVMPAPIDASSTGNDWETAKLASQ